MTSTTGSDSSSFIRIGVQSSVRKETPNWEELCALLRDGDMGQPSTTGSGTVTSAAAPTTSGDHKDTVASLSGNVLTHEYFMHQANDLAREASARGDHPFGAILVNHLGEVVLRACNSVHTEQSPVYHAELNLMRIIHQAKSPSGEPINLARCIMYTSTEPCAMCCGAAYWSGVRCIVFGCRSSTLEKMAGKSLLMPCSEVFAHGIEPTSLIGPIAEEEAKKIHEEFNWPKKIEGWIRQAQENKQKPRL